MELGHARKEMKRNHCEFIFATCVGNTVTKGLK